MQSMFRRSVQDISGLSLKEVNSMMEEGSKGRDMCLIFQELVLNFVDKWRESDNLVCPAISEDVLEFVSKGGIAMINKCPINLRHKGILMVSFFELISLTIYTDRWYTIDSVVDLLANVEANTGTKLNVSESSYLLAYMDRLGIMDDEMTSEWQFIEGRNIVSNEIIGSRSDHVQWLAWNGFWVFVRRGLRKSMDLRSVNSVMRVIELASRCFSAEYKAFFVEVMLDWLKILMTMSLEGVLLVLRVFAEMAADSEHEELIVTAYEKTMMMMLTRNTECVISELDDVVKSPAILGGILKCWGVLFDHVLHNADECKMLMSGMKVFARVLKGKNMMDCDSVYNACIEYTIVAESMCEFILEGLSSDQLITMLDRIPTSVENAGLLSDILLMIDNSESPRIAEIIRQLVEMGDAATSSLRKIVRNETLKKPFLDVIYRVNDDHADYNLIAMCKLLKSLESPKFSAWNIEEKLFMAMNAENIIDVVVKYPFLDIPEPALLIEFVPHDSRLYSLLSSRFLNELNSFADELISIDDNSHEYYDLLVVGFKLSGNHKMLWRAISTGLASSDIVDVVQEMIKHDPQTMSREVIDAVVAYRDTIVEFMVRVDSSRLDLNNTVGELYEEASRVFLECGCWDDNIDDILCIFVTTESELVRYVVFGEALKRDNVCVDDMLDDETILNCYILACRNDRTNYVERLVRISTPFVPTDEFVRVCLMEATPEIAKLVFDRISDMAPSGELKSLVRPVLSSNNIQIVVHLFGNEEKVCVLKEFAMAPKCECDAKIFECMLNSFELRDGDIVAKIWELFFSHELHVSALTGKVISTFFAWMAKSKAQFINFIGQTEFQASCGIAPLVQSTVLPILARFNVLYLTEAKATVNRFAMVRFSLAPKITDIGEFLGNDFEHALGLLSCASRKKFGFVLNSRSGVVVRDVVRLDEGPTILKSIERFTSCQNICTAPAIASFGLPRNVDLNSYLTKSIELKGSRYTLTAVLCDRASYIACNDLWIEYSDMACECVPAINTTPSIAFYQRDSDAFAINMAPFVQATSFGSRVARCLVEPLVDWTPFQTEGVFGEEFLNCMCLTIGRISSVSLFEKLGQFPEFVEHVLGNGDIRKEAFMNGGMISTIYDDAILDCMPLLKNPAEFARYLVTRAKDMPSLCLKSQKQLEATPADKLETFKVLISIPETRNDPEFASYFTMILLEGLVSSDPSFFVRNPFLLSLALRSDQPAVIDAIAPLLSSAVMKIVVEESSVTVLRRILTLRPNDVALCQLILQDPKHSNDVIMDEVTRVLSATDDMSALSGDASWLSSLLASPSCDCMNLGCRLLEQIWPPDRQPPSDVTTAISNALKDSNRFVEFYPVVFKYRRWFRDSSVTDLYCRYVIVRPHVSEEHFWDIVTMILDMPEPTVGCMHSIVEDKSLYEKKLCLSHQKDRLLALLRILSHAKSCIVSSEGIVTKLKKFIQPLLVGGATRQNMEWVARPYLDSCTGVDQSQCVVSIFSDIFDVVPGFVDRISMLGVRDMVNWPAYLCLTVSMLNLKCECSERYMSEWYSWKDREQLRRRALYLVTEMIRKGRSSMLDSDRGMAFEYNMKRTGRLMRCRSWFREFPLKWNTRELRLVYISFLREACLAAPGINRDVCSSYAENPLACFGSDDSGVRRECIQFVVDMFEHARNWQKDRFIFRDWGRALVRELRVVGAMPNLQFQEIEPLIAIMQSILALPPESSVRTGITKALARSPEFMLLALCNVAPGVEARCLNGFFVRLFRAMGKSFNASMLHKFALSIKAGEHGRMFLLEVIMRRAVSLEIPLGDTVCLCLDHIEALVEQDDNPYLQKAFDNMLLVRANQIK